MNLLRLVTVLILSIAPGQWTSAQTASAPYSVSVWARVLFGTDGKPIEYAIIDEEKYPRKFAENVRARVARAVVPPPEVQGRQATLRTGVELQFLVTPTADGGTVRLQGVSMGPIPVKRYQASYPTDIAQSGGWTGEASAVCEVDVTGRCSTIEVKALPGMPESVRRYMRASLEQWEFEPQRLDGTPIPGQYALSIRFNTLDSAPEDFREDKFLRVLRNR